MEEELPFSLITRCSLTISDKVSPKDGRLFKLITDELQFKITGFDPLIIEKDFPTQQDILTVFDASRAVCETQKSRSHILKHKDSCYTHDVTSDAIVSELEQTSGEYQKLEIGNSKPQTENDDHNACLPLGNTGTEDKKTAAWSRMLEEDKLDAERNSNLQEIDAPENEIAHGQTKSLIELQSIKSEHNIDIISSLTNFCDPVNNDCSVFHSQVRGCGAYSNTQNRYCVSTNASQLKVQIYKANISELKVDCIVNDANSTLQYSWGVAKTIFNAAGPALRKECEDFISAGNFVEVTDIFVSTGGDLPAKYVCHAVGPKWNSYGESKKFQWFDELRRTVLRCLVEASRLRMTTVALPSISAAIIKVPKEQCARCYMEAVKHFDIFNTGDKGTLQEIHFVDVDNTMVDIIRYYFVQNWTKPCDQEIAEKDCDFAKEHLYSTSKNKTSYQRIDVQENSSFNYGKSTSSPMLTREMAIPLLTSKLSAPILTRELSVPKQTREHSSPILTEELSTTILTSELLAPTSTTILTREQSTPIQTRELSSPILTEKLSTTIGLQTREWSAPVLTEELSTTILTSELLAPTSTTILTREQSTPIQTREHSPPILTEELSTTIQTRERSAPVLTEELATTILTSELLAPTSTTILTREQSTPIQTREHSSPILIEELSTIIQTREHSSPILTEEPSTTILTGKLAISAAEKYETSSFYEFGKVTLHVDSKPAFDHTADIIITIGKPFDKLSDIPDFIISSNLKQCEVMHGEENIYAFFNTSESPGSLSHLLCEVYPEPDEMDKMVEGFKNLEAAFQSFDACDSFVENMKTVILSSSILYAEPTNDQQNETKKNILDGKRIGKFAQCLYAYLDKVSKDSLENICITVVGSEDALPTIEKVIESYGVKKTVPATFSYLGTGSVPMSERERSRYDPEEYSQRSTNMSGMLQNSGLTRLEGVDSYVDTRKVCDFCGENNLSQPVTCCKKLLCQGCKQRASTCPFCQRFWRIITGDQPSGTMTVTHVDEHADGFENVCVWEIEYYFPSGIQKEYHPSPGKRYNSVRRTAFLPASVQGLQVLMLLRLAFIRKLTFTIGHSFTRDKDDCIIWNDIAHKTKLHGGTYGYPDPNYLCQVTLDLANKGVTMNTLTEAERHQLEKFRHKIINFKQFSDP